MITSIVGSPVREKHAGYSGPRAADSDRDITANVSKRQAGQSEYQKSFPTILVVTEAAESYPLLQTLRRDGYLVLQASCEAEALHLTISHSRPIQLLLADASRDGQRLATTLKPYRREMQAFFVKEDLQRGFFNATDNQVALAQIRKILGPPAQTNANMTGTELPRLIGQNAACHGMNSPRFEKAAAAGIVN